MNANGRRSLRYPPDQCTVAWIDPDVRDDKNDFRPTIAALVTDEALAGCGVITLSHDGFGEESECLVKLGDLEPLRSQIRWVKELNGRVRKMGVMYLE